MTNARDEPLTPTTPPPRRPADVHDRASPSFRSAPSDRSLPRTSAVLALVRTVAILTYSLVGTGRAFVLAMVVLIAALVIGALYGFSDRWLAIFSTALSTVTVLLVFLLQYRETRDTAAIQLKLNELLRAVEGAREQEFWDLEHLAEEEQENISRKLRTHRT